MEKIQFKYFRGNEVDQYSFYRIPKVLFRNNYFKNLSCEAKVLYGLLLDRTSLSIRNRWLDEEDRVYIIFTIEEVSEMLNCGVQKAVKLLKELDCRTGIGLIEKKRLGLGKPNIIYVKNFMTEDLDSSSYTKKEQNCEKRNLRISEKEVQEDVKSANQDWCKSQSNNTDDINTEYSNTDIQSYLINQNSPIDRMEYYRQLIRKQVSYESFQNNAEEDLQEVDELIELMIEVMLMPDNQKIRIAGVEKPAAIVKNRFQKITYAHIEYVCFCLKENISKIENIKGYMLTTLYNSVLTQKHYYQAKVNYNMYG